MLEIIIGCVIIIVCLACEGFFSGTETAIVSVDRNRLKAVSDSGAKKSALILKALDNPERFFSTTLLGTNMVAVLSNSVATFMVIEHLGEQYGYVTILIMSPLILIFGEIVPKTVYRYHAERISPYIIYPIVLISRALTPLISALTWCTMLFVKAFGMEDAQFRPHTTREDLANYLDMWNMNSKLKTAERKIIERIFDFTETEVDDVMIRLVNIEALEAADSIGNAAALAASTGYSRIPVYENEAYNIIGIVHAFDLLTADKKNLTLRDIMRPARYVPNTAPVDELLQQMRTEGDSIAVVVNEFGGTIGIITIEDILEEVVGEIYDEYDKKENLVVKTGKNKYTVKARMEIDELNDYFSLNLPKDDYETLAGFLLKQMGRIPKTGEKLRYENIRFVIKQADKRSIKEISLTIVDQDQNNTNS